MVSSLLTLDLPISVNISSVLCAVLPLSFWSHDSVFLKQTGRSCSEMDRIRRLLTALFLFSCFCLLTQENMINIIPAEERQHSTEDLQTTEDRIVNGGGEEPHMSHRSTCAAQQLRVNKSGFKVHNDTTDPRSESRNLIIKKKVNHL